MLGAELVVGYVFAWAVRKARRVAGSADEAVDQVLDAGVERVHRLVADRLGGERALARVEEEAANGSGELSQQSRQFLLLAIEDAAGRDAAFADALESAVAAVQGAQAGGRSVRAEGDGVAVGGSVRVQAEGSSAAALRMGDVTLGNPQVPGPLG